MTAMSECPDPYTFDVAQSAEQYSTLASTLAGLAFVALIFILTDLRERMRASFSTEDEAGSAQNHILVSLLCAMLGLIVTAILYGVLAAEQGDSLTQGRATSEAILSGIALAFSVMSLLYSLILLIDVSGLKATATEARIIVAILTPALATMFIGFAGQDAALVERLASRTDVNGESLCIDGSFYEDIRRYGATFGPLLVLIVMIILAGLSRGKGWFKWFNSTSRRIPRGKRLLTRNALPKLSLGMTLFAAAWSASWSGLGPTAQLSHSQIWGWLALAAFVMLTQSIFILWGTGGQSLEDDRSLAHPTAGLDGPAENRTPLPIPAEEGPTGSHVQPEPIMNCGSASPPRIDGNARNEHLLVASSVLGLLALLRWRRRPRVSPSGTLGHGPGDEPKS